jgi:hypothetical protein
MKNHPRLPLRTGGSDTAQGEAVEGDPPMLEDLAGGSQLGGEEGECPPVASPARSDEASSLVEGVATTEDAPPKSDGSASIS